jgi:hypothetical protein
VLTGNNDNDSQNSYSAGSNQAGDIFQGLNISQFNAHEYDIGLCSGVARPGRSHVAVAYGIRPFWIATGVFSVAFCVLQSWCARSLIASLLGRGCIVLFIGRIRRWFS